MGQSDDIEDATYRKHQDVCEKLNMDASAAEEAWKSYENIRENYTLEGDQLHWIGCALYAACRNTSTPTVGSTNVEGNCVSLTRLLKLCNLPLMEFFKKSKAWADMCNMPSNFGARINSLQTNFYVSSIIFQKYQPIFIDIFKNPTEDLSSKQRQSRRHKINPCRPSRLFEFGWSLFICIKGGISTISDDLVNSFHLLLVICDLLYSNALLANRKDLLNPDFYGLPENFNDDEFTPPDNAKCIVNLLCEKHGAVGVEATVIKEYSLKRYMNKLFNEKVLRGEQSNFSGILENLNFEGNFKAINKAYEQKILSAGDFDERIFLGPDSNSNIGSSPSRMMNDFQEQYQSKREQYATINPLAPPTPLTGRKYLKSKDMTNTAPISNPTQTVVHLQTLLVGCKPTPSENLLELFKSSSTEIKSFVETKVGDFGKKFCDSYSKKVDVAESSCLDFGKQRLQSAQKLFYKILELVLYDEKSKKPNFDTQTLLKNIIFLQSLFACCCEIVIYSYQNKDRHFPWILSALDIEPYYFYRVIEVTIKVAIDHLSREMVKHLNRIEEMTLESLSWKSNSPLWQDIEDCESGVPNYEDVALPGTFETVDPNTPGQPVLRRIALDRGTIHNDIPQSPVSSASERFQSPMTPSGAAKKRLFSENNRSTSVLKVSKANDSNGLVSNSSSVLNRDQSKPKRTGSLALFFRKFYNLTNTRMQNLCNALNIIDTDLKRKIWTIFEYSVMDKTNLMKDRHLDQILMSAVYVICKIGKIEKYTFTEIMRCYRGQPQAESHIYRSVLISKSEHNDNSSTLESSNNNVNQANKTPPTPTDMAGTSRSYGSEIRGDLIKFYNTVYVPEVQQFATKSGLGEGCVPNLTLSPLPRGRPIITSPVRRITGSLMTRVLDPKDIAASPAPQLHYCFNRSPAKDLEAINKMVTLVDPRKFVSKRLLSDDVELPESNEPPIKKNVTTTFVARKLENIIGDRRTQNS